MMRPGYFNKASSRRTGELPTMAVPWISNAGGRGACAKVIADTVVRGPGQGDDPLGPLGMAATGFWAS